MTSCTMKAPVAKPSCWERPAPSPWVEPLLGGDAGAGGERSREVRAGGWCTLTLPKEPCSLLTWALQTHIV